MKKIASACLGILFFALIGYLIGDTTGLAIGLILAVSGTISNHLDDIKRRRANSAYSESPVIPTPEESEKIFNKKPGLLKVMIRRWQTESSRIIEPGEILFKASNWGQSKPLILSYNRKLSPSDDILHIRVFSLYRSAKKRAKHFYIDAWCHERDAFRTYRLDRIVGAFSPKTGEEVEGLDSLLSILNASQINT